MKEKGLTIAVIIMVILAVCWAMSPMSTKGMGKWKSKVYELVGYEGVVYKINRQTGDTQVLVPADNVVGFIDVGNINFENEEAARGGMKAVSEYIRGERQRGISAQIFQGSPELMVPGVSAETVQPST